MHKLEYNHRKTIYDTGLLLVIAVYAFVFCWICGRRGFFAFDQSIIFDGGWRVLSGQIPYRDFFIPFGPPVFWLQALFFKIGGVNYTAYIAHAALINAAAALMSVYIVSSLYPGHRIAATATGLITATWFYPPFGTPWAEQTAFACALAALSITIYALQRPAKSKGTGRDAAALTALFIGGIMTAMVFLAKQNAGVFFLPLPGLLILQRLLWPGHESTAENRPRYPHGHAVRQYFIAWSLGIILTFAFFAGWVWLASDWPAFQNQFFNIPAELGRARLKNADQLLAKLFLHAPLRTILWRSAVAGAGLAALLATAWRLARRQKSAEINYPALLIAFYAIAYQQFFYISSYNAYFNAQPFLGVIFGILCAEIINSQNRDAHQYPRISAVKYWKYIAATAIGTALIILGCQVSFSRRVHDTFAGTEFAATLKVPPLRTLHWGNPTVIGKTKITGTDIDILWNLLNSTDRPFFIFPDFTFFYGLTGQISPQPFLWFHKGLTYPLDYNDEFDVLLTESLQNRGVRVIILERESFFGTDNRLNDFPIFQAWLMERFKHTGQVGIFDIYEGS